MLVEQILVDNYFCSEQKFLVISKSQEKEHRGRVQVYIINPVILEYPFFQLCS